MKKGKIRVLSAFLAFSVLFLSIPANALSVTGSNYEHDGKAEENADVIAEDETFIVEEDTSKRGQFEKHFLCSDGSYIAVTYPESVHYLNNDNYWEDVDLTPEYNTSAGKYYKSNGSFGYSFRESASSDDMVEIRTGGHTISWGLEIAPKNESKERDIATVTNQAPVDNTRVLTVSEAKAEIIKESGSDNTTDNKRYITDSKSFQLSNISAKIKYGNYTEDDSISLEYTVYQDKIEEDIIIGKKGTADSFTMNMNIGDLIPKINSDGSVVLTDETGVVIFRIGIPYTVDSAFAVCNDISVKAEKSGTNCKITYIPNEEWMNSPDRVYPVTLDPSISTNDYVANIEDTYVEESSTVNHSNEQYLYIGRNGNNKRNAIIRINKLPVIDDSMPIISAYLVLTVESEPNNVIDMKASYLDTALDFEDYDFAVSSSLCGSFIEYSYLEECNETVDFSLSSHICTMYDDAQWDEEHGYDYHGDFVIGLEYENDTSYVPPFYSSEYTDVNSKPQLVVRYGYSLPAGILNNSVYSFMNYGSECYMSVNGTSPGNNSNIYQVLGNGNGAQPNQKFKLEYVPSTGGYLLRSMVSSSGTDKVVSINRGTSGIRENMNVRLSSPGDSVGQEWLIVPVNYYEFKIVPRTNMSLAITSYGTSNGSNTGTLYLSTGNIFVKEYTGDNYNQKWYIEDSDGNAICTDVIRSSVETGTYYVSNSYSGKYLHRNTNNVNCARDKKAILGESTVQWKIVNLGDGNCTIQRADMPGYYLARDVNTNNGVKVIYSYSDTIAEKCKWNIRFTGEGYLVKNSNGKYLTYNSSNSTVILSNLSPTGTDSYKMQQWRFVKEENYTELGYGVSFSDFSLDIGESKTAIVNKSPSNASWSNNNDFEYSLVSGNQYVSFNTSTNKFSGVESGTAELVAEHKTTGIRRTFSIKVNKNAIIIIPGFLGSELYVGADNPYFTEGMPLFSVDIIYGLSTYQYGDTVEDLIPNIWWEYIVNIPSAINLFQSWYDSMRCNDDGTSKYEISVKEFRSKDASTLSNPCGTGNCYYTLYAKLMDEYSDKYSVDLFSYDWRLSSAVSALKLDSYINKHNYDKVVLIAHSLGGYVASGYLGLGSEQRNKVNQVFYLASPLLGVPEVANIWYNEDIGFIENAIVSEFGISLEVFNNVYRTVTSLADPIQNLICNYVSVYESLPSAYFFQITDSSYMSRGFISAIIGGENTSTECSTYASTKDVLTGFFPDFDSNLMAFAEAFHNTTFINGNHVSSLVDSYYYYYHYSEVYSTVSHVNLYEIVSYSSYTVGLEVDGMEMGDSLVPDVSGSLANLYPSRCIAQTGYHMTPVLDDNAIASYLSRIN